MVRVALFDHGRAVKCVEFETIPVVSPGDFRIKPEGGLSLGSIAGLAEELQAGQINGRIEGYHWYRQAGTK